MGDLIIVPPDRLRAIWPLVLPHLIKVREACNEQWIPEDVYADVRSGAAWLLVRGEAPALTLVCVLRIDASIYNSDKDLVMWIASSTEGSDVLEHWPQIEQMARQAGCKRVTFNSPRRGWLRRAKFYGFDVERVTFVRRIDSGGEQ